MAATTATATTTTTTLVVGATGATGKHVVQFLLDQGHNVKVVARSKDKMLSLLKDAEKVIESNKLQVTEASLLDLSDKEMQELVADCDGVVSCLGHNLTFQGMYGKPRRLVTDAVTRLTKAIITVRTSSGNNDVNNTTKPPTKFILMGSDGVANVKTDDQRSFVERLIIWLIRQLVPPHSDNEQAADYLLNELGSETNKADVEWSIVRPTDLIDGDVVGYSLYPKPQGSLFGSGIATRANVAHFMVELLLKPTTWMQWKFQTPVLIDDAVKDDGTKKTK